MGQQVDFGELIPIFPLPNAVLLPRAILPLHVFEERYRIMTRETLAGSHCMAVALLKPGFEPHYHTLEAPIHPLVCVGHVFREERLPDGRYNFLLQGVQRARILAEDTQRRYRRALLEPIRIRELDPQRECELRRTLRRLLENPVLAQMTSALNLLDLLQCAHMSLSDSVDALCAIVLQSPEEKQNVLSQCCLDRRAQVLCDALEGLTAAIQHHHQKTTQPRAWPPVRSDN